MGFGRPAFAVSSHVRVADKTTFRYFEHTVYPVLLAYQTRSWGVGQPKKLCYHSISKLFIFGGLASEWKNEVFLFMLYSHSPASPSQFGVETSQIAHCRRWNYTAVSSFLALLLLIILDGMRPPITNNILTHTGLTVQLLGDAWLAEVSHILGRMTAVA